MIKLRIDEIGEILRIADLDGSIRKRLESFKTNVIEIDEEFAFDLYDICNDASVMKGFNADYELNDDGRIMVEIADKIFTQGDGL